MHAPLAPLAPQAPPAASWSPRPGTDPVVVDTCVLVAGLPTAAGPGPWACIVEAMRGGGLAFCVSEALMREYRDVLARPAIARRLWLGEDGVARLLEDLARAAQHQVPAPIASDARPPPDPGDTHLWALLLSDTRLRLLTLDRRLLERSRMRRQVITPEAWWRERSGATGRDRLL